MPVTGVGGAVPDELLRGTGSTTTWYETYTTTTNETGVYYGEHQQVDERLLVNAVGVSSGSTTDFAWAIKCQDSASAATAGYTDMGISFPVVNSASGDSFAVTGQALEFARQTVRTRTGRPYHRHVLTASGTLPSITLAIVPAPGGLSS